MFLNRLKKGKESSYEVRKGAGRSKFQAPVNLVPSPLNLFSIKEEIIRWSFTDIRLYSSVVATFRNGSLIIHRNSIP